MSSVGTTGYLQGAGFSPQGDLTQLQLGMDGADSAKKAYLNWEYQPGTRRLTHSFVTDDVHSYMPQDTRYAQDDAGNVTSVFDASTQGGTTKPDYQCFTYDGNSRVTESWTPKTADCAAAGRTTSNIDGAAPYWTSYSYTTAGQRQTETKHTTSGDSTTTYQYDASTDTKPHTLDNTTGATTGSYTYDAAGNTTARPGSSAQQSLAWNTEGKLAKTTEKTKETSYLYDASGELLIRRAKGDGDTVLYLGGAEVRLTVKGTTKTVAGTRYYTANGQTIAVRTAQSGTSGTKLSFLASDPHGTASLAFDATTYAITKRYTTPFGAPRGSKTTTWPDDKAFLGKPADESTNLTHVGAREYDPAIGQFISVDPLLSLDQHQSLNGYSYANNSPITNSDPTGMVNVPDPGGSGADDKQCPPFCSADGQPHGPSVGNGSTNRNSDGTPGGGSVCPCGTSKVDSQGQTMVGDNGEVLSCAYGYCIGNVGPSDIDRNVGNFFFGVGRPVTIALDVVGLLFSPTCAMEDSCLTQQYDEWGAEHGWNAESSSALLGASVPFLGRRNGGEYPVEADVKRLPTQLQMDVAEKLGGVRVSQGYEFPNRRTARQAASEMVGNLGSEARAIRARDFRGGPKWMQNSDRIIGRESNDGNAGWRDDFLGHDFGKGDVVGPHVNVWGPGLNHKVHLFYDAG